MIGKPEQPDQLGEPGEISQEVALLDQYNSHRGVDQL